ncbi:MAG: UbiA family prenyltransferase [Mycobacterium leprae]
MRTGSGTLRALVRACHPEPTVTVTAVAAAFAASVGRGAAGTVAVAAAVLAGQVSVGWSNDWVDRERDARAGRRDKPVARGALPGGAVAAAALAALTAAVPLSFLSGWRAALAHLAALAAAWAYNLGVKATLLSPLPYAVAFALLPAFVVLGLPGHPLPPGWLVAAGALLGVGAHLANALPDIPDDLAAGVRGLPHRLGPAWSRRLAAALLLAASALLVLAPPGPPRPLPLAGLLAAALTVAVGVLLSAATAGRVVRIATGDRSRAPFLVALAVAGLDVALLVATGADVVPRG